MQADLAGDGSELIVCMTARIDERFSKFMNSRILMATRIDDRYKFMDSRFLDIFKIPIKAEAAEKVYHRKTMQVVRMRKAEDDKMKAEEEERKRLALK
jgi:hypothetical protein